MINFVPFVANLCHPKSVVGELKMRRSVFRETFAVEDAELIEKISVSRCGDSRLRRTRA